jgi:signal transduction histidine kinase
MILRISPKTVFDAQLRTLQLEEVAQNIRVSLMVFPPAALILAIICLQWCHAAAVFTWYGALLLTCGLMWTFVARMRRNAGAQDVTGRLTVHGIIAVWLLMLAAVLIVPLAWKSDDAANNAFLIAFEFAVLSSAASTFSACLWTGVPACLTVLPLLAIYTVSDNTAMAWLMPPFQVIAGCYVCMLGYRYNAALGGALGTQLHNEALLKQLALSRDAAENANRAKSAFLASMSHDLRTPLNAIIGFSDYIRLRVSGPLSPAKYGEYIEHIHTSGNHLLSLIDDVLDLAKIEAGKWELEDSELDLASVAAAAQTLVAPQAAKVGVTLTRTVAPDIILVGDERAIRQVLTNLLSNAVKFSKAGGTVTVFARPSPDGGILLGVEDDGIGMTPDGLKKALEPYGQATPTQITVEGQGTGLGLSIVKALIEAHGATFRISSTYGKGTAVWGDFPKSRLVAQREVA